MKILAPSVIALVLLALPAVTRAQYIERWYLNNNASLGPATSLTPGNIGNFDTDPALRLQ